MLNYMQSGNTYAANYVVATPCQIAQQSVSKWTQGMQTGKLKSGGNKIAPQPMADPEQANVAAEHKLEKEMAAWRRNSQWKDDSPAIEVYHTHSL